MFDSIDDATNEPEVYFQSPERPFEAADIEAGIVCLARGQSVIKLLKSDCDVNNGFSLRFKDILSALDCLSGIVNQAQQVLGHAWADSVSDELGEN